MASGSSGFIRPSPAVQHHDAPSPGNAHSPNAPANPR